MSRLWRVLDRIWSAFGLVLVFCAGMSAGQWIGFGKGVRAIADLVIEMRHTSVETPDPWDRGEI
ncbi:hypothetical protein FXB40_13605 [Bradyrhizobium rifense]|uniref:Uncharacterized protein n=1 Tax=Bradyrhizobium rifense TaxID=515499 RepID=A0A5D3KJJ9_9BRAD|nr:hypothetical protein [Bradyrhizobium rifense]TYL95945.1 hypothetical protein FXB40_13605 [Bradyrhizobium rifense]